MAKRGDSLTQNLRRLRDEAHTIDDGGDPLTKGEALAVLLWHKALGYKEKVVHEDSRGNMARKDVTHKPEAWAIQLIYERLEGKTPLQIIDEGGKLRVEDRVDELAKARVNELAEIIARGRGGPPRIVEKSNGP